MKRPLWESLFFEPGYAEAARIIGYAGIEPFAFWDAAKQLPNFNQMEFQAAVHGLTRYDKRDASPPRYEFTTEARKWMWGILGPAPDHPDYDFIKHGPVLAFREDIQKWKAEFAAKKAAEEKPPDPVKPPKAKRTKKKAA